MLKLNLGNGKEKSLADFLEIQTKERIEDPIERKKYFQRSIDVVNRLKLYFKGKVVDVGCSHGYSTLEIKKLGFDVCGIDAIRYRVEEAEKLGVVTYTAMMEKLPFKDKEKDTGLYSHVLEHSFDFEKASNEAKRVFKRLIIIVPIEQESRLRSHTFVINSEDIIKKAFPGKILHEARWNRFGWKDKLGRIIFEYVCIVDL